MTDTPDLYPFAAFLTEFDGGKVHTELSEKLREIALAVQETGKKGVLTWQVTIESPEAGSKMIVFSDKVTAKIPENRGADVYFISARGNLARQDMDQMSFDMGTGAFSSTTHRFTVDTETGEITPDQ